VAVVTLGSPRWPRAEPRSSRGEPPPDSADAWLRNTPPSSGDGIFGRRAAPKGRVRGASRSGLRPIREQLQGDEANLHIRTTPVVQEEIASAAMIAAFPGEPRSMRRKTDSPQPAHARLIGIPRA